MKYCPTTQPRHVTLHIRFPTCFCKLLNFGTNKFDFTLNLTTHLALNHHQFPITRNYSLCPQQFCNPHFLRKTGFNSHSLFLCFFFGFSGIGFGEKILTLIEGLARSRNDVGEKGLDTWDFSDDGACLLALNFGH
jgi:hypothetical protein